MASMVAMMAGSDFIKTSTGKESVNATLPVGLVMIRAIQNFHSRTGKKVSGFDMIFSLSHRATILYLLHIVDWPEAGWRSADGKGGHSMDGDDQGDAGR